MAKNTGTASNGLIVCTASNAGLYPFPMAPMYAASKHGVVGLVRSLARPLLPLNIRINALAPAVVGKIAALSYYPSLSANLCRNEYCFKSGIVQDDDYHTHVDCYNSSEPVPG